VTTRQFLVVVLLLLDIAAGPAAAQSSSRSVLVIDQSDVRAPFYYDVFAALRSTINADSKSPTAIYIESLDLSRFSGPEYEETLQRLFRVKYPEKSIGVIVAIGDASLEYVLRWRSALWPGSPVVFAMAEEATVARLSPETKETTGLTMKLSFADAIIAARAVVLDLKRVIVVGDPWEKQVVLRHWKNEISTIAADVEVSQMIGLTMRELQRRVGSLPDHTAIIYTAIFSDGEGVSYPPADAVALIAASANRPVVVPAVTNIGRGSIGGFVLIPSLVGRSAGELASRILNGESASTIPIRVGDFVRPVFDWRELQRWGVKESSLPPGSEIRFREVSLWDQYRVHILAITAALFLQTALIAGLVSEHRRRRKAEVAARSFMSSTDVGIWDWDVRSNVISCTPELEKIYGLRAGSLKVYSDFRDRVHPDDVKNMEASRGAAIRKNKKFQHEFRIIRPSGEVRWVLGAGGVVHNRITGEPPDSGQQCRHNAP